MDGPGRPARLGGLPVQAGAVCVLLVPAPSDGSASLDVWAPDDAGALPTPEQAAAYRHLVDGQEAARDAILQAVLEAYPETQALYGMANGQKTTQTFWLCPVAGRSINTALVDMEGGAHTPVGFDLEGALI